MFIFFLMLFIDMLLCVFRELFLLIMNFGMMKRDMFLMFLGLSGIFVSMRWMMLFVMLCLFVEIKIFWLDILKDLLF